MYSSLLRLIHRKPASATVQAESQVLDYSQERLEVIVLPAHEAVSHIGSNDSVE